MREDGGAISLQLFGSSFAAIVYRVLDEDTLAVSVTELPTPAEGERLARLIGDDFILMMENHGPLVVGASIGEALLRLIYLEDTCRMQLLAEAGGHALQPIPARMMEAIPRDVPRFKAYAKGFMVAVVRSLTREEPDFLT